MIKFKNLLIEIRQPKEVANLKSWINKTIKSMGIKIINSSRGGYHVRFGIPGNIKNYKTFFAPLGLSVSESNTSVSSKFTTYTLKTIKKIQKIPRGTTIFWVNNDISTAKTGPQLFGNKDLTPDNLGLAGREVNKVQIIKTVTAILQQRYSDIVSDDLIKFMENSYTTSYSIKIKPEYDFPVKDRRKISADFGEILAALWSLKSMKFNSVYFPVKSNEKMIDFYGKSKGIEYPISVKSGGGAKVSIQNIIDAIEKKAKSSPNYGDEKAIEIFKIVNNNYMKPAMIKLHQLLKTPAIRKLGDVLELPWHAIDIPSLQYWLKDKSHEEINDILKPFWKILNTTLTDRIKFSDDKLRRIVSPLGESIWPILNKDVGIKNSLENLARQVILIQVNVDVQAKQIRFKKSKFADARFEWGWAGYAAGNKLGFRMITK